MSRKNIEDIYPLSPMQQGMLFHYIYEPESAVYVEQLTVRMEGELDVEAFQKAWEQLVQRHPIFRTAFVWEDLDEPLQVVHRQVTLPFERLDWREKSAAQQKNAIQQFMAAEREKGFDLLVAPLMRLALIQLAEQAYYFSWTYHHIIIDGWAVPLVLRELFLMYEAFRNGQTPQLPSVRPYRDYIAYLKKQDIRHAEQFWKEFLQGFESPNSLRIDHLPGRKDPEQDYLKIHRPLSETLSQRLNQLAREQKLTMNTLIQGAWAQLLSVYCGADDVVYGVTVSGRPADLPGADQMIGLFINTLPMRVQIDPDQTVRDYWQTIQHRLTALRQFEYTPLVQIQRWSQVASSTPLFHTIFVFENYPVDESLQSQQQRMSIRIGEFYTHERTNYPITFVGRPGKQVVLETAFDARRFDRSSMERLLQHLENLLQQMVDRPDAPLKSLQLLTPQEFQQWVVDWNATAKAFPNKTLVEVFEQQVARSPEEPAVVFQRADGQTETLTYRELNQRANQLARYLIKQGVKPGTLVGICLERSPELLVGIWGILKAGGAYVPLDPTYPENRLHFMVQDAAVPVLLVHAATRDKLTAFSSKAIDLEARRAEIETETDENPAVAISPDHLAYVIYTSGSTGEPKGTLLKHRGVVNLCQVFRDMFQIGPGSHCLQFAAIGFDGAVSEIFPPLLAGAVVYMAPRETLMNPQTLVTFINEHRIHLAAFPPSLIQLLPDEDLPYLRAMISAGEACPVKLAAHWGRRVPFYNGYGPTESTVGVSFYRVNPEEVERLQTVPIGKPINNVQLYVMDAHLRPCPPGVPGELFIGGVGLAEGYLGRQTLTREKFVPHPFKEGERLYRTGDLVRLLPNGELEFLGRIDFQVKLRGFRIELGEIEAQLNSHPLVEEAVVMLREEAESPYLAAYIIPVKGQSPDPSEIRDYLMDRLPDYMVPGAYVFLEAFPLTPNGKVDRQALPAPEGGVIQAEYVAPRNPVEEVIASIFSDILKIERIGARDNFFDLGGHSLMATQLVSRLRDAFQVELSLREMFETPTVEGLAQRVETAREAATGLEAVPLKPIPRDGSELPLSFAQQRLWFLDQLEPGSPFYNIPVALRIRGELNIDALQKTLSEIVRRHEVLRTTFKNVEGKPVLEVHSPGPVEIPLDDLRHLSPDQREAEARQRAREEARTPFDLAKGPLFRTRLIQLGDDDFLALITMHHIISDGWSIAVFIEEVAKLYPAFLEGNGTPLPELPIQYADFAAWQRKWLQGERLEKQLNYWRHQLADAPPVLELPTDKPRPPVQTFNGDTARMEIPAELVQWARAIGRREGATLFMTLLAAFQALLSRYSGQDDVVVGTPIAGRNRSELEKLIGFFVNTLALRAHLEPHMNFRQLLRQVRQVSLGAYAHQDLPFEQLVEALQPERNMSHSPIFQVMFVFQNQPMERLELPGITLEPFEANPGIAKFDISFIAVENEDRLFVEWEYNTDLFEKSTIQRMMTHFQKLLQAVLEQPDEPLSALPLMDREELNRILVEWNNRQRPFDRNVCVHEKFAGVVREHPDAIAVEFWTPSGEASRLTYRELDKRANQLAHYLQKMGVSPETLVGISMERSLEMVIGILGVLKAGGAFVPIDPTYPPERVAFMLQDSHVTVLLTHSFLVDQLPEHHARVVALDREWAEVDRENAEPPRVATVPENLAYVIYTSGSTGKPKGTMLAHRGLINLAQAQQEAFDIQVGKRILQFSALSFDASVWELVMALLNGATLVLTGRENIVTGQGLLQVLRDARITTVTLPPSVLAVVPQETLPQLETIILAGEKVTGDLVDRWGKNRLFFNAYGPTETTVCASMHLCQGHYPQGPPIGGPIPNFELYVLDPNFQPVPVGVPGELFIGGPGLARGYLDRSDLTAEKFVPHPFSHRPGERLYRSGDLVRWLPNGELEFLGRVDFQVKVRGFRIELGEIEAVLSEHQGVKDAVVVAREDRKGDKRLVAYFIPVDDQGPTIGELRDYLRRQLPDYMVPATFVRMEVFPLTPSGKIDRRRLPQPEFDRRALEAEYVAPRNDIEEKLVAIVSDLLDIEKVGVYDNFFDLGGHSLLATQFISRIRTSFELELPLRTLFENPTIAGVAQAIEVERKRGPQLKAPEIRRVSREARKMRRPSPSDGEEN